MNLLNPNDPLRREEYIGLCAMWVGIALILWLALASPLLPSPVDVVKAVPDMWQNDGLGDQLWISFRLNAQSLLIMSGLSLLVAYLNVVPALRPVASFVSIARFSGLCGLPLILTLWIGDSHWIKVALLVYGTSLFTIPALVQIIQQIPRDQFDHARTLRMKEWRVVWEVVVLGQADNFIDALRINAAMMWMMLPMAEALFKSEGGIGVMLDVQNKHFELAHVYATVGVVLLLGWAQDRALVFMKQLLCPYAFVGLERAA